LLNLDGIVTRRLLGDSGDVVVADHVAVTGDGGQPGGEGRVLRQEPPQALQQFGRVFLSQVLFLPEYPGLAQFSLIHTRLACPRCAH